MYYEIRKNNAGQYFWCLKTAKDEIVACSSQHFEREADCQSSIHVVKNSSNAPIENHSRMTTEDHELESIGRSEVIASIQSDDCVS